MIETPRLPTGNKDTGRGQPGIRAKYPILERNQRQAATFAEDTTTSEPGAS
jgi:hypothetical protein